MRMLFGVGVSLVLLACSQTAFATFSPKFLETLGLEPFEADQSVEEELLPGLTISAVRSDRGDFPEYPRLRSTMSTIPSRQMNRRKKHSVSRWASGNGYKADLDEVDGGDLYDDYMSRSRWSLTPEDGLFFDDPVR